MPGKCLTWHPRCSNFLYLLWEHSWLLLAKKDVLHTHFTPHMMPWSSGCMQLVVSGCRQRDTHLNVTPWSLWNAYWSISRSTFWFRQAIFLLKETTHFLNNLPVTCVFLWDYFESHGYCLKSFKQYILQEQQLAHVMLMGHYKTYNIVIILPVYNISASYKHELDNNMSQHVCCHKYAKKLGLEMKLMGHYKTYYTVFTLCIQ